MVTLMMIMTTTMMIRVAGLGFFYLFLKKKKKKKAETAQENLPPLHLSLLERNISTLPREVASARETFPWQTNSNNDNSVNHD